MASHTFVLPDDIEEKWQRYEKEKNASFSKMARKAILEYLTRELGKK